MKLRTFKNWTRETSKNNFRELCFSPKMDMASNYGLQCSAATLECIYCRIILAGSIGGVVWRLSVAVEAARCSGDGGDGIGFGGGSQLAAATMAHGSQLADLGSRRWKRRLAVATIRSAILIGGVRKSTVIKNKCIS